MQSNVLELFLTSCKGSKALIFVGLMTRFAHDSVLPVPGSDIPKKQQVAGMFDNIAGRYDFLNRFLSAGIDRGWRRKALMQLKGRNINHLLDVATGTGDVAIMAMKLLNPQRITGIDISEGMINVGKEKILKLELQNINLLKGDSEAISFPGDSFDAVTVAFGVRNFQDLEKGLSEIRRVLKPGGKLVVLEFSKPRTWLVRKFYDIYMKVVCPYAGRIFSKNRTAYQYLDNSIKKFPEGKNFTQILESTGFKETYSKPLTLGICSIYCGIK